MFEISNLIEILSHNDGFYLHIAVFSMLILGGMGFPFPEDLPLLISGISANKGIVAVPAIMLNCYLGVLIGDQIIYGLGFFFGKRLVAPAKKIPFLPQITSEKAEQVRSEWLKRKLLLVFLARHLFPLRAATYLTAGIVRIPFWEFLFADAIAAVVSVIIMFSIGYFIGERLTPAVLEHLIHEAHFYIIVGTVLVSLVLAWRYRRKRRK
ncbi:MAG: DedA family protein [bacterium]|nr:DedA family protein [bacterium]